MNQFAARPPERDAPAATLERWLTGPRFAGLPARDAALPPPALSFEFFPPRTEALEAQLWSCIRRLEPLAPRFVSVTYGAGGSTQARTHATVSRILRETDLTPAAHLTCVDASREAVDRVARDYWEMGVRHIVALRGDQPAGAAASGATRGWVIALVATKAWGTTPPNRSPSPWMPSARAASRPTRVSAGSRYTGPGGGVAGSYSPATPKPISAASRRAASTRQARSCCEA